MSPIPREERILNLLSALLAARGPLGFADIRDEVSGYDDDAGEEALEKRFDRDKADLRRLGVPLEYLPDDGFGRAGYRIERERFFLEEIRFTPEEGIVLAAIQRTALAESGGTFGGSLRSALAKISVDSPLPEAFRESVGEQQVLDARVPHGEGAEADPLSPIGEALAGRRPVRFSYYALRSGEQSVRTVEPYGVGYYRGQWYLVGRDADRGEVRTFRTSRIRGEVRTLPATSYEIPDDFDLKDHIGRSPWELAEGQRFTARIRFAPEVAWMMAENLRGEQSFAFDADEGGILTLPATDPEALVRWVAQYGPAAEILEPEALRERMVRHLDALIARYRG